MVLRLAILGAGRIGKTHAQAVAATNGAQCVAVADPVADAAQALAGKCGASVRTIDEIETAQDVDAVIICTPTDTHADLIERFARARKAVFCEKPVDLSVARVQQCLAVVEETGTTLMVGFNRRYDPDFLALKSAIDAGHIGNVEMVTLTSRDPGPPPYDYIERSGGIFKDMTIHDFDVARWLLGEEVESVQAAASVLVDREIGRLGDHDSVSVILRTAGGRQCTITNSRRATYGYDQRIEVLGSEGALAVENIHQSRTTLANAGGFTRPPLLDFFMTRYSAAYAAEIATFVQVIESGGLPPTTGHDGLMALVLAEAAARSVAEKRLVSISEVLP
ncbi:MAG: inositol 2-dehydrogenase [Paracoccus sp. (in: a-proteobacteria)]|uniref:inositol 2-dehydrogenase n=1 Tax=Paracoccus sp. TaxID=267 RepID=UPI0040582645